MTKATDEILTVHVVKGVPGDRWVKCPHCKETVNLPPGPVRGEAFQHTASRLALGADDCGGWFEIDAEARLVNQE